MYDVQHQYVTVRGDQFTTTEQWQFGLRITDGGVSNEVTALAIADDIERWWRNDASYGVNFFGASSTQRLTELKVARIRPDGTYPPDDPSYSHFYLPPIVGPSAPLSGQSAQQTIVATLLTAMPRGLASKGRIYLPRSAKLNVDTATGLIPSTAALEIAESVRQLINEINANAVVGNVAIFSKGVGVKVDDVPNKKWEWTYPNPGVNRLVTGVRVGRVIDTQRRRRRSLDETPQVVAL